jgi:1,4-dihydroxy-2-naphthoate octaprenyltransferase
MGINETSPSNNINLQTVIGPMRLPFLILAPACTLVGIGSAAWTDGIGSPWHIVLALAGALAAHISVNAFNEYFDYKSGLDFRTVRTPFSGGSGTLPQSPGKEGTAWVTAWVALAVTAFIGAYFLITRGWALLPFGLLGVLVIYEYTQWLTRSPILCLIAPGLGFGPLMVMGTDFVLNGSLSWSALAASLAPFFLVSNLLLLNQFPDVDADRSIGRRHFPITIGRKASARIYVAFLALAYLSIIAGVLMGLMPPTTLLGLLTLFLAVPTGLNVLRNADDIQALMPSLGMNVIINILTPVLVGVGFLLG